MAIGDAIPVGSTSSEPFNTPLLSTPDKTVPGAVDYKRRPAVRSKSGRWRSACFIIGKLLPQIPNFPNYWVLEFC